MSIRPGVTYSPAASTTFRLRGIDLLGHAGDLPALDRHIPDRIDAVLRVDHVPPANQQVIPPLCRAGRRHQKYRQCPHNAPQYIACSAGRYTHRLSPLLEASQVRKHYGGVDALESAHFGCAPGEVHALMGENGAGKSTLARILAGSTRPDARTPSESTDAPSPSPAPGRAAPRHRHHLPGARPLPQPHRRRKHRHRQSALSRTRPGALRRNRALLPARF